MPASRANRIYPLCGETVGCWTVVDVSLQRGGRWVCRCSCGALREVECGKLLGGASNGCPGCVLIGRRKLRIGQRVGMFEVVATPGGKRGYLCKCCSCGLSRVVRAGKITAKSRWRGCRRSFKGISVPLRLLRSIAAATGQPENRILKRLEAADE
jgi:hypothetical protein